MENLKNPNGTDIHEKDLIAGRRENDHAEAKKALGRSLGLEGCTARPNHPYYGKRQLPAIRR